MSGGGFCTCPKPKPKDQWVVIQRRCNHSAFSGYHRTGSDYSSVHCKVCMSSWRTKADYVNHLPNGSYS